MQAMVGPWEMRPNWMRMIGNQNGNQKEDTQVSVTRHQPVQSKIWCSPFVVPKNEWSYLMNQENWNELKGLILQYQRKVNESEAGDFDDGETALIKVLGMMEKIEAKQKK